jgi:hypothetical protein
MLLFVCLIALATARVPHGLEVEQILQASRECIAPEIRQRPEFKIDRIMVVGDKAFWSGALRDSRGKKLQNERYTEDNVYVLLTKPREQMDTASNKWTCLAHAISCTDLCWASWADRFDAPASLFPGSQSRIAQAPRVQVMPAEEEEVRIPRRGGRIRRDILRALGGPIDAVLHQHVLFKLKTFNILGDAALYQGVLLNAQGGDVDYTGSRYQAEIDAGFFDNNVQGVVRRKNGMWVSEAHAIGCTDVCWFEWPEEFDLPRKLFRTN